MNNNSQNHSPERKGHLHKLSAEQLEAITVHQHARWSAYANMYKAVELSYQVELDALRKQQPQVIQNVAGVAIANEAIQKPNPYTETQPVSVAQPEIPVTSVTPAPVSTETSSAANPLLADAYKALDRIYEQQELGQDDVAQAA